MTAQGHACSWGPSSWPLWSALLWFRGFPHWGQGELETKPSHGEVLVQRICTQRGWLLRPSKRQPCYLAGGCIPPQSLENQRGESECVHAHAHL